MNIVAFIPARSGSKSIPDKNIKLLGDKPLIAWSIEVAQKCGLQSMVSTDSEKYAQIAKAHGAEVLIRPIGLAKDQTSMFDVVRNEVFKINPLPDLVLLLQPTSPFRKSIHIKTAISYLTENLDKYDSVISVERVPEKYNPAQVIISTPNGKGMVISKIRSWFGKKLKASLSGVPISQRLIRRQDFPEAWIPTGSIYLFKIQNLERGSIYGDKVMLLETEPELNINTKEDWLEAEQYARRNNA